MEWGLGHIFFISNNSHFVNETDLEQGYELRATNFSGLRTQSILIRVQVRVYPILASPSLSSAYFIKSQFKFEFSNLIFSSSSLAKISNF